DAAPLDFLLEQAQLHHDPSGFALDALLRPPPELAGRARLTALITGDPDKHETLAGNWTLKVDELVGWPWLTAQLEPGVHLVL
ncbi:hypothetical protein NVV43_28795, partial [Escherichia marmotae]|nr:hypothetical protein [Escherichia marmotae]